MDLSLPIITSQVFWLVLCFSLFLLFCSTVVFPAINKVSGGREEYIKHNADSANLIISDSEEVKAEIATLHKNAQEELRKRELDTKKRIEDMIEDKMSQSGIESVLNSRKTNFNNMFNDYQSRFDTHIIDLAKKMHAKVCKDIGINADEKHIDEMFSKHHEVLFANINKNL